MGERRSPVVVAGLAGGVTMSLPTVAHAISMPVVLEETFSNPGTAFAVGIAGGAAIASLAGLAIVRARGGGEKPEPPDERPTRTPKHLRPTEAALYEEPEPASGARSASHAATNYEDIAENYVGRVSFKERMARRAEGVAATLRERMGQNMMEGVPVIARADGSVGDVGTTWWKQAVGEDTIIHDSGFADTAKSFAIPSDFSTSDRDRLVASARQSSGSISNRVPFVDEGAYPARRTSEDLDSGDIWESALKSIDEKIAAIAPAQDPIGFIDSVGGADSLEEPDNLEPQTAFIHFKAPGGHPEVVDTESYVDYLIEDEFSKNSSKAVRRSSHRFLRILEGGTQTSSRHLADSEPSSSSYVGKHFSMPLAAEA